MRSAAFYPKFAGHAVLIAVMLFPLQTAFGRETAREQVTTFSHAFPELLRDGDIVFQTSLSSQSRAIQLATRSPWSHCGILYKRGGKFYVFEAVHPVKSTPLEVWIARGLQGRYVVKRLKNADVILTESVLRKMRIIAASFAGKPYDRYFAWSDNALYCSELIWKIYRRSTGLEIGRLQKMKDFALSHPAVRKKLRERYGNHIPLDEKVISPVSIFRSDRLLTVFASEQQ